MDCKPFKKRGSICRSLKLENIYDYKYRNMEQYTEKIEQFNEILIICLKENFNHARHQEIQRNKLNHLYFLIWGTIIGLYGKYPNSFLEDFSWLFVFLSIFSLIVFINTLKWNAEFMNHICAAAKIVFDAKINVIQKDNERSGILKRLISRITLFSSPVPYPHFSGYMALPLHMPIFVNVSVLYTIIQSLGICISTTLTIKAFRIRFMSMSDHLFITGSIIFIITMIIAAIFLKRSQHQIQKRYPINDQS